MKVMRVGRRVRWATILAMGVAQGAIAASAAAQGNAPAGGSGQTAAIQEGRLDEIVVTARRFEERLQSAPVTVTAFTSETIARRGIRDITELSLQTPGFAMQNASRTNEQPFIRGMSVNSVFRDQQNASFFIDGIYVAGVGRSIGLDDIERVEVVLGPQATTFGRQTFAGAVNYVSRKPTDDWRADARLAVGEHGLFDASSGISGPIVPGKLAFRLYGQYHTYDGEYTNSLEGQTLGEEETQGMSASLRFTPTENFDATVRVQYTEFDDGHSASTILGAARNNCLPNAAGVNQFFCGKIPIPQTVTLNLSELVDGGFRRVKQFRSGLFMNLQLGDFTLSSNTGFNDEEQGLSTDGDNSGLRPLAGTLQSYFYSEFEDFTQELRLTSPREARLRGLVGATYFHAKRNESQLLFPLSIATAPAFRETDNKSVFGQVAYDIVDTVTGTLEARYQSERIGLVNRGIANVFEAFLPRATLDWRPTNDLMLYGTVAKGNKPGSFNTASGTPIAFRTVREEEIWNYELGLKSEWLDRRLRFNAAAYYIDWTGQGIQQTVEQRDANNNPILIGGVPRTVVLTVNAGKSEVKGLETDLTWVAMPGLELRAAYSYTDAEYVDFLSRLPLTFNGNLQVGGNDLQNTPLHKLILSADYTRPISSSLNLFLGTELTIRGKQYLDELNTAYVGGLSLLNARVGVEAQNWSLTAYGRNLTNSKVPDFATRTTDFNAANRNTYQVTLRPSRAFGLIGTVRF